MPEIYLPGKIIFGKDNINKFHPEGCESAIIICDNDVFCDRGFLQKLQQQSTKMISHVRTVVNSNIHELYLQASEKFFEFDAELIIAAGGAAAIDCGMLLSHEGKTRFTAIPCCAASAMSDFETGCYEAYRHSPDTVILDSALFSCMPSGMIAFDGFACLAYAIDTLKNADNVITRDFAVSGAVGILKNIIPACRGNIDALERLMYAMYFSVAAHRNITDLESSLLSRTSRFFADFGYPRASVCALIVPNVMEDELPFIKGELYEIALKSGVAHADDYPDLATDKLIEHVRKIQAALNVPRAVSGFGLNENEYRNKMSSSTVPDDFLDLCYYGGFKFMKL